MYKTKILCRISLPKYTKKKTFSPFLYIALVITSHPLLNGFVNLEIYFFVARSFFLFVFCSIPHTEIYFYLYKMKCFVIKEILIVFFFFGTTIPPISSSSTPRYTWIGTRDPKKKVKWNWKKWYSSRKIFVHLLYSDMLGKLLTQLEITSKSNNRIFQITYPKEYYVLCAFFFIILRYFLSSILYEHIWSVVWFGSFDFHHVSAYFFCFIHISSFCSLCMNNILTSISQMGIGGVIVWWAKRKYFLRDFFYSFSFRINFFPFPFVHYYI